VETALDIAARGLAATVTTRGLLHLLGDRLPPGLHHYPFRPRIHETFAIAQRRNSRLSRGARAMVEIVRERLDSIHAEVTADDA
jgi:hypothetical protein